MRIKEMCAGLLRQPKGAFIHEINKMRDVITNLEEEEIVKDAPILLSTHYTLLGSSRSDAERMSLLQSLTHVLSSIKLNNKAVFFNFYGCIMNLIYKPQDTNSIKNISEEEKLAIVIALTTLIESLTIPKDLYQRENVPKLSPLIDVCIKLAKFEKLVPLRIASINCILSLAHLKNSLCPPKNLKTLLQDFFVYFIPGLASGLTTICTEDEICNHKVLVAALKAWSRLIGLAMDDSQVKVDPIEFALALNEEEVLVKIGKIQDVKSMNAYLDGFKRTGNWYKEHDVKLELCVLRLNSLVLHDHVEVRLELISFCNTLISSCMRTIPKTMSRVIEVILALTEDYSDTVSTKSDKVLLRCVQQVSEDIIEIKILRDYLEQNFYDAVSDLPTIFNGLDERKQLSSLKRLIGYLKLFGQEQFQFSLINLDDLIGSLLVVAKLENTNVSLLEEYKIQELTTVCDNRTPWKVFAFRDKGIQEKLESLCGLLSQPQFVEIIFNSLLDIFRNEKENRKEATLLLNEIISHSNGGEEHFTRAKTMIDVYLDYEYWNLDLDGTVLGESKNNIVQICLQLEGIGKIALSIKERFKEFLLKILYPVLEKAGSGQHLLKAAGLTATTNISLACGYSTITDLVNKNSDYFSHHVIRKLKRNCPKEDVLNVLSVVMRYSTVEILTSITHIIEGVLLESFDKHQLRNINSFLRVFLIFVRSVREWFNIEVKVEPVRSKKEKERELEGFTVSNLEEEIGDFSDEAVMGKSAEELFKEDEQKSRQELDEEVSGYDDGGYKKPEAPSHIKLTVAMLQRVAYFLPSIDDTTRLLCLEILTHGIEIIRDWEDELLPIVHQIWAPLLSCFDEIKKPLIIHLSFHLLTILARLSKDFIRSRTIKDVLPVMSELLIKSSAESYLKDKGSAYRYTQLYKMQVFVLPKLFRLAYDLDLGEANFLLVVKAVEPYISDKQPVPLQEGAVEFYKSLLVYDSKLAEDCIKKLKDKYEFSKNEFSKNLENILT